MTCRECGATIAVKAIVCYKCGTPTADVPAVPRGPVAAPARPRVIGLMVGWVLVVSALGVWLIPQTPDGTWMRWAAWGAIPVVTWVGARLIRGPRSSRLRRQ